MTTIVLNRGELSAIPLSITDTKNLLAGKRVTWSIAPAAGATPVLKKASGLGVSSADVTISTIAAGSITGFVNIAITDFATLTADSYVATVWVDSGANDDRCMTPGGVDTVTITKDVSRT